MSNISWDLTRQH